VNFITFISEAILPEAGREIEVLSLTYLDRIKRIHKKRKPKLESPSQGDALNYPVILVHPV